jgi:LuxR family quorum sensing-dependent transcriptional regulator
MHAEAFAFIERLDGCATAAQVMDAMERALAPYGFDRLLVGQLSRQQFDESAQTTRWPAEFLQMYRREDYFRFSPVARRCRLSANPFQWCTADFDSEPEPRAVEVMRVAADFGLAHGFVVPIHGPNGFEACVSLAGTHLDLPAHAKPAVHMMAIYAHDRLRTMLGRERCKPVLTAREQEVLAWVAGGKSAWEIGEILNIAKRTVDEHAQTAFRKLGAVNRTHAVAIAMRERIIGLG